MAVVPLTYLTARFWFPVQLQGLDPGTYWLIGLTATLLLFASVLFHEAAHTLIASIRGQQPTVMLLLLFGAVSDLPDFKIPLDEFITFLAGPLASLGIAGAFWLLAHTLLVPSTPAGELLGFAALVNVLLGGGHLLPVVPFDGARILHSVAWRITGNESRASRLAAPVGQLTALALICVGGALALSGQTLNGVCVGGCGWLVLFATQRTQPSISSRATNWATCASKI